jgi:hypothetical protein
MTHCLALATYQVDPEDWHHEKPRAQPGTPHVKEATKEKRSCVERA